MKPFLVRTILSALFVVMMTGNVFSGDLRQMIDSVELIPGEDISYISVIGFFDPELYSEISIQEGPSSQQNEIVIPNATINNVLMPDREITEFSQDGIVEKLFLEESIQQKSENRYNFLVGITVFTPESKTVTLEIEKSSQRQLTFALHTQKEQLSKEIEAGEETVSISQTIPGFDDSGAESVLLHPVFARMAYRQPIRLNVAAYNASPHVGGAQRLAIMLNRQQRRRIEQRIGMRLEIVNISSVREQLTLPRTKIYFRPNLLKAAMTLAEMIPGEQVVEEMPFNRSAKMTTDVEIYVGENFE